LNKLKTYKFRLYPNKEQQTLLSKTFGCVRFFWNIQVAMFNSFDKNTNPKPNFKSSTLVRKEFDWMQEVSASSIQQKEIDFKQFKNQFFSKTRKSLINRPTFKKKNNRQSYRLPNQKFTLKEGKLRLEKIGWLKVISDR